MNRITLTIISLAILALSASSATAQLGIYGEYSGTRIPGYSFAGTTTAWYQGFSAGAYDNLLHAGPVQLGLDLRGGYAKGSSHGYRNFLIGPRLAVKPPLLPIRPYIQAAIGFGGVAQNGLAGSDTQHYSNKLQYGFIGGLDYTLVPHIDLRLVEVGYLRMSAVSSSSATDSALNLTTIGAGLVVRLP
jgi:hypothetical protein